MLKNQLNYQINVRDYKIVYSSLQRGKGVFIIFTTICTWILTPAYRGENTLILWHSPPEFYSSSDFFTLAALPALPCFSISATSVVGSLKNCRSCPIRHGLSWTSSLLVKCYSSNVWLMDCRVLFCCLEAMTTFPTSSSTLTQYKSRWWLSHYVTCLHDGMVKSWHGGIVAWWHDIL